MNDALDLKDVEAFVAIAEEGSFTAAARRLGVNQSVISTRVAHLEEVLRTRLLDRGARRSTPTPAGAAVLKRAHALVADAEEFVRQARRLADVPEGTLEVGASTVPGTFYLPTVLVDLRRHAPDLVVDLRITDSATAIDSLRRGTVELTVIGHRITEDDLESTTIWDDPIVLVASRQLAAQHRSSGAIGSLPLVMRRPGSATRLAVVEQLAAQGVAEGDLKIAMIAADNEVAREAALAGIGATFLSERAAHRELQAGQLVRLDRRFEPVHRPLVLVTVASRTLSAGARMLAELLHAQAR